MLGGPASVAWLRVRWSKLRLASKFNLTLAGVGIVSLLLAGLALDQAIRPAFDGLEQSAVTQQIDRANAFLGTELSAIESATKDYAVWDDSFDFVATRDPAFAAETLNTIALVNVAVNAVAYAQLDGELLYTRYVDLGAEADLPEFGAAFGRFIASPQIFALAHDRSSFSTYAVFEGRILAIGGAQVVRSDESGTPAGYVIMARELAGADVSPALQTTSKVSTIAAAASMVKGRDAWEINIPISSLDGASVGSISFEAPRDTSKLGGTTILAALGVTLLMLFVVLAVVYLFTRAFIVQRLSRIDRHMQKVTETGDLAPLNAGDGQDEIGSVGRSFNAMILELKELREQIETQSYQLGQSESAAGAMHNVRNSLNPVAVILSQVLSEQSAVSAQNLEQALRELSSGETAPARRERLAAFLQATFADMDKRNASRREACLTAKTSLAEALEILRSQSDTAHKAIPLERFDILDVVRRNANLNRFAPWGEIDIAVPTEGVFVRANRLLMSQVIGNLMTNAIESIVVADRRPGRLSISMEVVEEAGAEVAIVRIRDDGKGFEPQMAARLFERGYTSKVNRSGGLGLHWCANTVSAMGGSLSLESAGLGAGACAIVRLRADRGAESHTELVTRTAA